jgi:hypothetical protein
VVEPEDRTVTYTNAETGEEETYTVTAGVYGRPSIYSSEYPEYTHSQILEVLSGEEWVTQIDYMFVDKGKI